MSTKVAFRGTGHVVNTEGPEGSGHAVNKKKGEQKKASSRKWTSEKHKGDILQKPGTREILKGVERRHQLCRHKYRRETTAV